MSSHSTSRTYDAPGPGTWEQDSTHNPLPVTVYKFASTKDSFPKGFREGTARYGLLFDYLEPAAVNGFLYSRPVLVDGSNREEVGRRFEAARNAFENKIWFDDLERWDREVKPDSIRRNRALEAAPLSKFDNEGMIGHLTAASDNAEEMVYRHHIFTVASVLPVGTYLAHAVQWTGLDSGLLLAPLQGRSPISLGAFDEMLQLGAALRATGVEPSRYAGLSAGATIEALRSRPDELGAATRGFLHAIGMRLAGGYDVSDACAFELPDMLLGTIWASRTEAARPNGDAAAVRVRDAVPDPHRVKFDELLSDARRMNRLRDERGIYNDSWAYGIARQSLLECGRRLFAAGKLDSAELAIDASLAELVSLLRGTGGPSSSELRERADWRRDAPLSEVPAHLGPPPAPPPPLDGLPPHAFEAMRAMGMALSEVFMPAVESKEATILGRPVSPGTFVGTARVIKHSSEFSRLKPGDVLVTASTSPAFNVVLPLLGAIVTDRGGQLSHAAIIAREYGIPAVVGTGRATVAIPDGARVEVDGTNGRIRLL